MVPSCRGVFTSVLPLVFPQALHFSFSIFPPDLGWPFQQRWSTAGPHRRSVRNQRSPALKGYHRLPLWVLMRRTHPKHECNINICFSQALSQAELSLQPVLATLLLGVCSAWHPSFTPRQELFGQCEILCLNKCFTHIQNFCWSKLTIANGEKHLFLESEKLIGNKHGMRCSIWKPQKDKDLPFKEWLVNTLQSNICWTSAS